MSPTPSSRTCPPDGGRNRLPSRHGSTVAFSSLPPLCDRRPARKNALRVLPVLENAASCFKNPPFRENTPVLKKHELRLPALHGRRTCGITRPEPIPPTGRHRSRRVSPFRPFMFRSSRSFRVSRRQYAGPESFLFRSPRFCRNMAGGAGPGRRKGIPLSKTKKDPFQGRGLFSKGYQATFPEEAR